MRNKIFTVYVSHFEIQGIHEIASQMKELVNNNPFSSYHITIKLAANNHETSAGHRPRVQPTPLHFEGQTTECKKAA